MDVPGSDAMTRIRTTCPRCGEVELRPDELQLHIVGWDEADVGEGSTYLFDCPRCADEVVKPADARIAQLLTTGGVPVVCSADEEVPDGAVELPPHPEHAPDGPPLTPDDLLDLHELLQTDEWFERLRQTC